jgi:hypothetical protein
MLSWRIGPKASIPGVAVTLSGTASFLYHLCDLEILCILNFWTLQALDVMLSVFSVLSIALYLVSMALESLVASARVA